MEDLGNKLIEEHAMVSEMAFLAFNDLIDIISITKDVSEDMEIEGMKLQKVKSSALDIAEKIVEQLKHKIKIVLNNSKFNDQLKI